MQGGKLTPKLIEAKYVKNYTIFVRFEDGTEGEIDFSNEFVGEVFEPLKDKEFFRRFRLNSELNTIVWPNGADFAPEFLYKKVKILA